jgi:hypothetical protein
MSEQAILERGYRRLLAGYPKAYRRENGPEILAVLMAAAGPGQRRPGLAEAADLIRGGLRMRLCPRVPSHARTVLAAVRLMYLGALTEVAALITIIATTPAVRAATMRLAPAQWPAAHAILLRDEIISPAVVLVWLWLAWANGRGRDWGRFLFITFTCLTSAGILLALASDGQAVAPADLLAAGGLWLLQVATLVLLFRPASGRYFQPGPAAPAGPSPLAG